MPTKGVLDINSVPATSGGKHFSCVPSGSVIIIPHENRRAPLAVFHSHCFARAPDECLSLTVMKRAVAPGPRLTTEIKILSDSASASALGSRMPFPVRVVWVADNSRCCPNKLRTSGRYSAVVVHCRCQLICVQWRVTVS